MTRLEQIRWSPDVKAIGANIATAGMVTAMVDVQNRAAGLGVMLAGMLLFAYGKSIE